MKEMSLDGRKRLVFVLKEDSAATIVIPVDVLQPIDYKRLKEMEAMGGELMKTMRDTKLADNGRNALELYKHLIQVAYKGKPPADPAASLPAMHTKDTGQSAIKRGRGRPRKNAETEKKPKTS